MFRVLLVVPYPKLEQTVKKFTKNTFVTQNLKLIFA